MTQLSLLSKTRPKGQLLKWVGNKYRYAQAIAQYLPEEYPQYIEPFVGTGAVLCTLEPNRGIAGDTLAPLIGFWCLLQQKPHRLVDHYQREITRFNANRQVVYDEIRERYNKSPNPLDLLILSRTCYGGVMRFTKDGKISTPIGPHNPISPEDFARRAMEWRARIINTEFYHLPFSETMAMAGAGDVVYCDPPYVDSQSILYGAQTFSFADLIVEIDACKQRGARVVLSIDGKKKSGQRQIELEIPVGLFEREVYLDCGSSMLKRFQNGGKVMIGEDVHDRLLFTW